MPVSLGNLRGIFCPSQIEVLFRGRCFLLFRGDLGNAETGDCNEVRLSGETSDDEFEDLEDGTLTQFLPFVKLKSTSSLSDHEPLRVLHIY